jgi:predicted amidophosphoribosyltransferase
MIGKALATSLSIPFMIVLKKQNSNPQLKDVPEYSERIKLLEKVLGLSAASSRVKDANVLLVDDLWRSGATLNAAATLLLDGTGVADVFALTITKTRSNR